MKEIIIGLIVIWPVCYVIGFMYNVIDNWLYALKGIGKKHH